MWGDDIKCKYMFKFPLKNLARIGLSLTDVIDKKTLMTSGGDLTMIWHGLRPIRMVVLQLDGVP